MEKYNRISEIFWMFITIATTAMVIYLISTEGIERSKYYIFIPLLAAAMSLGRRMIRKRLEKTKREMEEKSKKSK